MSDLHDLAVGYALHALDDPEQARFERHLRHCPACKETVQVTREAAAELAAGVAEDPPPGLRRRVLELAERTPQLAERSPQTAPASPGRSFPAPLAWAAVLALVLALGGGWWAATSEGRLLNRLLDHPDATTVAAEPTPAGEGRVAAARVVVVPERQAAVLVVEGLAPVDESRVYELWVIDQGGPQPAGLFRPGEDGSARVLVAAPVTPGVTLAVTEEPASGSPQPTGEVLLVAEVGA